MKKKIVLVEGLAHRVILFKLHFIKEFLSRGYIVVVIAPYDAISVTKLKQMGVKFESISLKKKNGYRPLGDLIFFQNLCLLLRREKPDIVFFFTIKPIIYGSVAARIANIPAIYSMIEGVGYAFSNLNVKSKVTHFIVKRMLRFSLKFNKIIFFLNEDNLNLFKESKILKAQQKTTIVNGVGVDTNFYKPTIFPKEPSFLMISRPLIDKGIREYFEAARRIKSCYPHVQFRLLGTFDFNPNSISQEEYAKWLNMGFVEYLGEVSDVRGAISDSSVNVLPSYAEGISRAVLEAMAMGRPIITTDAPGCKETVVNQRNGFLVPVRDVDALCVAIEYFIKHPKSIETMGQLSRKLAIERFDVNKINKDLLQKMEIFHTSS